MNLLLISLLTVLTAAPAVNDVTTVILVVGKDGEPQYGEMFNTWASRWIEASAQAGADLVTIGLDPPGEHTDRELLRRALEETPHESNGELYLVFIGHGQFDGKTAKFNHRGPDFSAQELAEWLKPFQRPLAIINCTSSSAPFVNRLTGPNRVVVTATKSGFELNFAHFGDHFSTAIADPTADLDKDGQTSLLEAFLMASRRVGEFYQTEARLATEHGLIDDNGDGLGTPASWFKGLRAVQRAEDGARLDGHRAQQFNLIRSEYEQKIPPELRAKRDLLVIKILDFRDQKEQMAEDEYYEQLEVMLLELARLYLEIDKDTS